MARWQWQVSTPVSGATNTRRRLHSTCNWHWPVATSAPPPLPPFPHPLPRQCQRCHPHTLFPADRVTSSIARSRVNTLSQTSLCVDMEKRAALVTVALVTVATTWIQPASCRSLLDSPDFSANQPGTVDSSASSRRRQFSFMDLYPERSDDRGYPVLDIVEGQRFGDTVNGESATYTFNVSQLLLFIFYCT